MKLFVWDFHGTLEKGNERAVLEVSNSVLKKHGYKQRFSELQNTALYGKKWFEYFEDLLPNEANSTHLELQADCFTFSIANPQIIVKYIQPVEHALEVLTAIRDRGHDQILVSNTKPASLKIFMESIAISEFFPEGKAFATDAHSSQETKSTILKNYLATHPITEIVVIGDSPRDIELGKITKSVTFLYTHPGQEFKDCQADFKINDLREILTVL